MKIGPVTIAHGATLAPMEEHTGLPFRLMARRHGASLVASERVDACDVAERDKRALKLLRTVPHEAPAAGQLSGADPAIMAAAARVVEECGFALVDLNFDCPVRRLMERGEAGALMADPERIARIVAAVVAAVAIPVTLKIRSGPDAQRETAVEIARLAEAAGAALVSVHARNVQQAYAVAPDWTVITRVKQAVRIPVLGGGGLRNATDALALMRQTGCDGVAIGRGCLGNPWIFAGVRALLTGSSPPAEPGLAERGRALLALAEEESRHYGREFALRRLPRLACYFAKPLADFAAFRTAVQKVRDLPELKRVVGTHFR